MRPFLPKLIQITEHEVIIETSNSISSSENIRILVLKDNLERRLSAIYKEDFVLLYTNSNVFTTLLKLFFKI
jgi:hypothetical protein